MWGWKIQKMVLLVKTVKNQAGFSKIQFTKHLSPNWAITVFNIAIYLPGNTTIYSLLIGNFQRIPTMKKISLDLDKGSDNNNKVQKEV